MFKLNLEKYFYGTDNKYYNTSLLISILTKILGKNLDELNEDIINSQIFVTKDEIKDFLKRTFQEENPILSKRIEEIKKKNENDIKELELNCMEQTVQDIRKELQNSSDLIAAKRYEFEPYTLDYFNKYISIVRNKALQLLHIIELIGIRKTTSIQETLVELDIQLDENGNITRDDIIRLIVPTVQNIIELEDKVTKANNLSTYLTFKLSKHHLYRNGFSEGEVYPSKSIFVKDLIQGYNYGNIPISKRQEEQLHEKFKENSKIVARILTNLD